MGKKKQKPQSENEQVEDIMAWGKSKNNYYQQQQQQYSEASEEQDQAKQIYQNQHQHLNLNQQQFYQLPEQQQPDADDDNQHEFDNQSINQSFIDNEIIWVAQLARAFEPIKDHNYLFRKKVYDSYLLILMTLKKFRIPFIDQHPLLQFMPLLKKTLRSFQKQIPQLYKNIKNQLQEQNSEQQQKKQEYDQNYLENYNNVSEKKNIGNKRQISQNILKSKNSGLTIYNKIRMRKQKEKKIKKSEGKLKRQQLPMEAFKTVSQTEARLANEKILKNKGLMKRRSRGDGNSRVKLKYKYQKALIRRRAQGHIGVKQNPGRFYQGQNKVLYGKISSTKLQ